MRPVWFTLGIASLSGIIFALVSLLFYFGEWSRLLLVSILGFSIGTIAAPEIDASLYKHGWAIQIIGGIFGGASLSSLITTDIQLILAVSMMGGLVGWLGPFWVKHIQVP